MGKEDSKIGSPLEHLSAFTGEFFQSVDDAVERALKNENVSCKKGCVFCCYQLVSISGPEAVRLAFILVNRPNWKSYLPLLREDALYCCQEGLSNRAYFLRKKPCVFLEQNKICSIYEYRPLACRLQYVKSASGNCSPDHETGKTLLYDFSIIKENMWKISLDVFGELLYAPLSLMVLHFIEAVFREKEVKDKDIENALLGIPEPTEWFRLYGMNIAMQEKESYEH